MSTADTTASAGPPAPPDPEQFERLLTRLDGIVARLEGGEASLEESLTLFEEGVRLGRSGEQLLDRQGSHETAYAAQGTPELPADGTERPLPLDEPRS